MKSRVAQSLHFFRRFLDNPREVGAICPSTRHLGTAMLASVELQPGDVVVEYGAGTGSLTGPILEQVRRTPGARYLGIEREPSFCAILHQRFPTAAFACAQVEDLPRLLAERDLPAPRAVISGLPLILLPTMDEILATTAAALAAGGTFRTFSYLQSYPLRNARRLRAGMAAAFDRFTVRGPVLRNFPPAFVLCGDKTAGRPAGNSPLHCAGSAVLIGTSTSLR
jgi:phospholipid N-methyltransferase